MEIVSNSADETAALGKQIAGYLSPGCVIALQGTLGSGKTCFARGIASGLGISENLTSPTYTIINEYSKTDCPALYHIDAWRLSGDKDFEDIGGLEIIYGNGICVIEWSERILKSLPENTITITLDITGHSSRLIKINGIVL